MKYLQGKYMFGYLKISVHGERPELFFEKLTSRGIYTWEVFKQDQNVCHGHIRAYDKNIVKKIAQDTSYEITFDNKQGIPYLVNRICQSKELIVAGILSIFLFFSLSQVIWSINISGVSKEIETKINNTLENQGIKRGAFKFLLNQTSYIQQNILQDVPELLWIGVEQKGTSLNFTGIEKITQDDIRAETSPQHLIAKKNGVIKEMRITKGVPLVSVNNFVKTGDKLVSGNLQDALPEDRIEDADNEPMTDRKLIAAKGEVIAKTWYEVDVSIPLKINYDRITSNHFNKYYISFGNKQLLIWGFKESPFEHLHIESEVNPIIKFKQGWTVNWLKKTYHEKQTFIDERTIEEAKVAGIAQAEASIRRQLGKNANILSQKVLHESTESGKVKLTLLMTVKENIAKEIPISQGD